MEDSVPSHLTSEIPVSALSLVCLSTSSIRSARGPVRSELLSSKSVFSVSPPDSLPSWRLYLQYRILSSSWEAISL